MQRKMKPLFSAVLQWMFGAKAAAPAAHIPMGATYADCPPGMQPTPCQMPQSAHSDATSFTDARYFISAQLPDTYDATGYQNTGMSYTEITLVSDFPVYGAM